MLLLYKLNLVIYFSFSDAFSSHIINIIFSLLPKKESVASIQCFVSIVLFGFKLFYFNLIEHIYFTHDHQFVVHVYETKLMMTHMLLDVGDI